MFKKTFIILIGLALVVGFVSSTEARSRYTQCVVDARVPDNDCQSNTRKSYSASCCPSGYRVQGVAYNDMSGSDYVDAVSAVCRHVKNGNIMMPTDFQTQPVRHVCKSTEIMIGLACKDMPKGGDRGDILDGCTAICQNPKSKKEHMLYSKDLEDNRGRDYVVHKVYLPNRITGIHYKEIKKGSSDRADCATVSYKYQPIVAPGK